MTAPADLGDRVERIAAAIRARGVEAPVAGIVLGSGLGPAAEGLADALSFGQAEVGLPASRVPGHDGRVAAGRLGGVPVVALQGRVHAYEGHEPWEVALGARVLCRLGARLLVLTNASGGIRPGLVPGGLMRVTDHLNLSGMNPLTGTNDDRLGPRFPDLSRAHDPHLGALLDEVAAAAEIPLTRGVYAWVAGPSYETPSEVRMLRTLGADAVGMSTVPEVIAAAHMGVPAVVVSCVTNLAAGVSDRPLTHVEVAEVARAAAGQLRSLLAAYLPRATAFLGRPVPLAAGEPLV